MISFILKNAVVRFIDPGKDHGGRRFHDKVHVHTDDVRVIVEGFKPPAVYPWERIIEIEGMDE